ncbi:hypothetical protein DRJ17_02990 [Candidatus Woesearchaeota archaeon]|nr:MAG: hypothetical protein DRJ17_02990 [Candidatus Woesearchaeota archaeon]
MNKITHAKVIITLMVILIVVSLSGCQTPEDNTIKIGFIGPLTGPVSAIGIPTLESIELSIDQINENGGIKGRRLQLIVEDGACNPKLALTAANKLIYDNNVSVIINGVCSSSMLAMAPLTEENKVILISPIAASPDITNAGDYVFRLSSSSVYFAKQAAKLANILGYKKIGVIYENNAYTIGMRDEFERSLNALDGEVIVSEIYESTDQDIRTQIIKVAAKEPDAILVVPLSAPKAVLIATQIKELGIDLPILGGETYDLNYVLKNGGSAVDGIKYASYGRSDNDKDFMYYKSSFKAKYGKEIEDDTFGANAYDTATIIAEAMQLCEENTDCIRDYLYSVKDWKGASGKISIDENGDVLREFMFYELKNGKRNIIG